MMRKFKRGMLIGLAAIALAACGSGNSTSDNNSGDSASNSEDKQVLNWSESAELPTMDTTMVEDVASSDILANTTEGLYRKTLEENEYENAMAIGDPEISEDGKTYTFKLREDATWSNGDPVTANDFVFAWQRFVDPEQAAPMNFLIDGLVANATEIIAGEKPKEELGVKAVDDHTLEVTFENVYPYWKQLLSMTSFAPLNQKFVEEKGDQYGTNSDNTLYNGPFILDNWDGTGLEWQLVKNDSYWDKDKVQLDQINYNVVKETNTAMNLFQSGEIDYAPISGEYVQQVQGDPQLKELAESSVFHIQMNQQRDGGETPLANEHIRRAITSAIDRESLVKDVLKDTSIPSNYFVPKGMTKDEETGKDFREISGENMTQFDPELAQEEFKKGLEEIGQDSIQLELLGYDTDAAKSNMEFLQGQLQQNLPGLTIQITSVPFKNGIAKMNAGEYDINLRGWGADFADPINFLSLYEQGNSQNTGSYENPEYNQLIQQAQNETDASKRLEMLAEAEKILVEDDAAVAPLYQRSQSYLLNDRVQNVGLYPVGDHVSFKWASVK
ncbi:peptide ABC transporter substrate-binding protein [Aerococcus vaginalis]